MTSARFHSKLAGVSFPNDDGSSRQDFIQKYCYPGTHLILRREPRHRYDRHAVAVWAPADRNGRDSVQIGYLSKIVAEEITPLLDGGAGAVAETTQVTGGTPDKPTRGVNVLLKKEQGERAGETHHDDTAWSDESDPTGTANAAKSVRSHDAFRLLFALAFAIITAVYLLR